jgi:hypothetical protein
MPLSSTGRTGRAVPGVRGDCGGDGIAALGVYVGIRLGRARPARDASSGMGRSVFHPAYPAAGCGADRGGRYLRAPVRAAPQSHRRGRRVGHRSGSGLGHRLPLLSSPLSRPSLGPDSWSMALLLPAQARRDDHGHLPRLVGDRPDRHHVQLRQPAPLTSGASTSRMPSRRPKACAA